MAVMLEEGTLSLLKLTGLRSTADGSAILSEIKTLSPLKLTGLRSPL